MFTYGKRTTLTITPANLAYTADGKTPDADESYCIIVDNSFNDTGTATVFLSPNRSQSPGVGCVPCTVAPGIMKVLAWVPGELIKTIVGYADKTMEVEVSVWPMTLPRSFFSLQVASGVPSGTPVVRIP
jgi:hypothetical protein